MWQLMQQCWLAEPSQRPTIAEVTTTISTFPEVSNVEPARNEWDESFPRLLRKSLRGATLSFELGGVEGYTSWWQGLTESLTFDLLEISAGDQYVE